MKTMNVVLKKCDYIALHILQ